MNNSRKPFTELFYQDSYAKEALLEVVACHKLNKPDRSGALFGIVLSDTIFYPEGGGQLGDIGFLDDVQVLDTRYFPINGVSEITHFTKLPLTEGQTVRAKIDWERRFSFMQQHSAEHLLSGLAHERYGYDNVGFHLGETETTLDFSGYLTEEQIDDLIYSANELIWKNVPLTAKVLTAEEASAETYRSKLNLEGAVRLVTIPGGDSCACCATHVHSTGELGQLVCTGSEKWKGGVRLTLLAGDRALAYSLRNRNILQSLTRQLFLPSEELLQGVLSTQEKLAETNEKVRYSLQVLFSQLNFSSEKNVLLLTMPIWDDKTIKFLIKKFSEEQQNKALLILWRQDIEKDTRFFLSEFSEQDILKQLKEKYQAKGGGPAQLSQGSIPAETVKLAETMAAAWNTKLHVL